MTTEIKATIDSVLAKHGLTVESVFVPFSKSRNKNEKNPSLNWQITLKHNGRVILTTDYSAGCAHCPSYQQRETWDSREQVKIECEKGFPVFGTMGLVNPKNPILPDSRDVIYSLLIDSEVLNYSSFESWAGDFGYDADSRSHEKIYNACLKIALQFRQIGESVIDELREAYQDY